MSTVIPFKALRPHRRFVEEVASYPYDVLEEDEARKIVAKNPNSFLRVEKSEIDLPPETDPNDERVFISGEKQSGSIDQRREFSFRTKEPAFMSMVR